MDGEQLRHLYVDALSGLPATRADHLAGLRRIHAAGQGRLVEATQLLRRAYDACEDEALLLEVEAFLAVQEPER